MTGSRCSLNSNTSFARGLLPQQDTQGGHGAEQGKDEQSHGHTDKASHERPQQRTQEQCGVEGQIVPGQVGRAMIGGDIIAARFRSGNRVAANVRFGWPQDRQMDRLALVGSAEPARARE